MIESEDERWSSETEDNQEQVGHQSLCGSILYFFLERILLYNKLKNTRRSFHGESSTGCTSNKHIFMI